ncbi:MAG: alkaline phosphatase family protein, partial [Bacteroidales bacterium]|nr:alkaline phosphatase family protein [Bacteroidales bacterium]
YVRRPLLLLIMILFLLTGPLPAQYTTGSQPPRLIVGIVVDGLPKNWMNRFHAYFSTGGFQKLVNRGVYYTEAEIPFMLSGKGPAQASISTGALPFTHGIVAEKWYNRLRREEVSPTYDFTVHSIGSEGQKGKQSAARLLVPTVGDILTLESESASKVISIGFDPESSILLGGHHINASYWFDTRTGKWITSSAYKKQLPGWVKDFNSRKSGDLYLSRDWNLLLADNQYHICLPDDNPFETGFFGHYHTFPYRMNRLRRESMSRDYTVIGNSPYGNTLTVDFALSAVMGEKLGKDDDTDLLLIDFSSNYAIARRFGSGSREVMDALLRLDMDLQHLLYILEEQTGQNRLLVFLTSTHGMARDPDQARSLNLPGGYFRYRNAMALLNSYLSALYGDGVWVDNYIGQQIYLNETQIDQAKISYDAIIRHAARFLTHFEGVSFAIPMQQMSNGTVSEPWSSMAHHTFHPDRSGDIILILKPGWIDESEYDTDCLSPYPYDTKIPLIWYGMNLQPQRINRPVSLIDIAPTLSAILHIPKPDGASGAILPEIVN